MSDASSLGIGPTTISSQDLCNALRTAVNDTTFGQPLTSTDVIDYEAGQPEDSTYVLCELATDPTEMSSHESGGGSYQPALAELSLGGPYLDDGTPSNHPSSWFLEGHEAECRGSDDSQLGTMAATMWCLDDTAHGWTVMYFNDLMVIFDMQAPLRMTRAFTYDRFLAARTAVLDALVQQ